MIKTKKIKDNIHGYIYFSNLEAIFLSHPLVLRLHNVRQNGAAFLTYPSIRVHRYEHSLGAMHLAGQLLVNAIRFSSDYEGLMTNAKAAVAQIVGMRSLSELRHEIEHSGKPSDNEIEFITKDGLFHLNSLTDIQDDDCFVTLVLYQAVRIAMLVHDIGHPPFSHTFEMGLKQLGVEYADHERVGLELLDLIVADIKNSTATTTYHFAKEISKIVAAIVDKSSPFHELVQGVADIVSGDVDADRLDYVKRDALSGGLSTNSYDVGRLFDAMKLVPRREGGVALIYHAAALSTLEAFFGMRFHLYRWMLWHHSVIMRNMVLVSLTHSLHDLKNAGLPEVSRIAEEAMDIALNRNRRADYWFFNDSFLLTSLTRIYNELPKLTGYPDWLRRLFVDLQTFLFRKKDFIAPFWKRPDDYYNFAKQTLSPADGHFTAIVTEKGENYTAALNAILRSKFELIRKSTLDQISNESLSRSADNVDYHSREFCKRIEATVNARLGPDKGRIRAYYLAKFKPAPEGMVLFSGGEVYPLGVLSPSIPALETAWESLPQLWFFLDSCGAVKIGKTGQPEPSLLGTSTASVLSDVSAALEAFLRAGDGT